MNTENGKAAGRSHSLVPLALANSVIWILSVVALIVVLEKSSSPKGMFVPLAAGLAVSLSLISALKKSENEAC